MKKTSFFLLFSSVFLLWACSSTKKTESSNNTAATKIGEKTTPTPFINPESFNISKDAARISSPNGKNQLFFKLDAENSPVYKLIRNNKIVVGDSKMGFQFFDGDFNSSFEVLSIEKISGDETWKPVWGEVSEIRDNFNGCIVHLKHTILGRIMDIVFEVHNDGLGFRYVFPEQDAKNLIIIDESTEFQMVNDMKTFWIPGDYDSNEHIYSTTKISAIDNKEYKTMEVAIHGMALHDANSTQTPLTLKNETDGTHLCIHEAALLDFPAMQLVVNPKTLKFKAVLVPSTFEKIKASVNTPFKSPWRTIVTADNAAGLLESKLILNLNDPNVLEDVSWIKPQKYVGIWWDMHVGTATWDYTATQDMGSWDNLANKKPHGKHGATTERTKRYIDFASKNGFDGVLVEGWNIGWEGWFGKMQDSTFSFTTPYPDYNIDELSKYAASKGVKIICHHETSSSVTSYDKQMDKAYQFMKKYNMNSVKTGYVGRIVPKGEHHDGQYMVNHYAKVMRKTAENKIMVDMHEPTRLTGLHRTYPNFLSAEAARGNEFNAWSRGNAPEHETILPFTRLMGGPMDYTPGIFQTNMSAYDAKKTEKVHTTLSKQLALYVTMYSPLQMAADLIENYEGKPEFQFIKDVAVDWEDTKIINAEVGDYLTIARKAKGKNEWFIGSITDEKARNFDMKFDFLPAGKKFKAIIYADADDAHWDTKPAATKITEMNVSKDTMIKIKLAASGGCAISLKEF